MPSTFTYRMNPLIYGKLLKKNGGVLKCYRCGKEIKLTDDVTSAPAVGNRVTYRIYHKACFEETLI